MHTRNNTPSPRDHLLRVLRIPKWYPPSLGIEELRQQTTFGGLGLAVCGCRHTERGEYALFDELRVGQAGVGRDDVGCEDVHLEERSLVSEIR